jgi:hypothetical protein
MNDVYTPPSAWEVLISAELLYDIAAPIARRMAQNGPLGPQLHAADVVAEVRANPSGKSTDELIAECNRAVEERDRESALRAIAELMHVTPKTR